MWPIGRARSPGRVARCTAAPVASLSRECVDDWLTMMGGAAAAAPQPLQPLQPLQMFQSQKDVPDSEGKMGQGGHNGFHIFTFQIK